MRPKLLGVLFFYLALHQVDELIASTNILRMTDKELHRELGGSHLRMSAATFPPWMWIEKNANGTFIYRGHQVEICDYIAKALNITYHFVNVRDDEVDKFGIKEATVLLLLRKEVDISSFSMALTLDNCIRTDCSVPVTMTPVSLMVPWPEEESRLLAPIHPFHWTVWFSLLATITILTFVLAYWPGISHNLVPPNDNTSDFDVLPFETSRIASFLLHYPALSWSAEYLLTTLTNQGNRVALKRLSFRIVVVAWCLSACVLVNAYSGTLISYLTVPKYMPIAKSFEDLAANDQPLKLLVELQSAVANDILRASSGATKLLGDTLRKNPDQMFTNRFKGFEMVYTGRYAYVAVQHFVFPVLMAANNKAGYCRFTISKKRLPVYEQALTYGFQRDWRYTKAVNRKLQAWWDVGLATYSIKAYERQAERCLIDSNIAATAQQRKLSLRDLSSAFVILVMGLSLSILVFLIERIVANRTRNR